MDETCESTISKSLPNEPVASAILAAFLGLGDNEQEAIRKQVRAVNDPKLTKEERRKAEMAIRATLRLGADASSPIRPLRDEQRLSAEHLAVHARIDREVQNFAETLEQLLAEKKMTQAELATRVGVGQSAISMMLSRKCRPQPRTLGKLAEALEVPVEKLWPCKAGF